MLRDKVEALEKKGVKDASLTEARNLLGESFNAVIKNATKATGGKSAIDWMENSPCNYAEEMRLKILDLLVRLDMVK
jgi:hypothetical protein